MDDVFFKSVDHGMLAVKIAAGLESQTNRFVAAE